MTVLGLIKGLSMMARAFCVTAMVGSALSACGRALAQDQVEILPLQSLTFPGNLFAPPYLAPGREGTPAAIFGLLRVPAGVGRVPAVVMTHGCSGLTGAETWWGRHLRQLGIATFIINSFVGRDISRVCSDPHTISMASLLTDVYRAQEMLTDHPRIDSSRIAVLGFSLGGRTALWASHPRLQRRYGSASLPLVAYLAFYPTNCHIKLADEVHNTNQPVRIFHGEDDELVAIERCREYVGRRRSAGQNIDMLEYPAAKHWFDNADLASRQTMSGALSFSACTFEEQEGRIVDAATGDLAGPQSPCVVSGGSFGYNAAAHRQAAADVETFLNAVFVLR
jgi:dienelactone hydrolase